MAANTLPRESGIILTAEGKLVWRHWGRGPDKRRLAMKRAYQRASCDSMAVDPPRTEGGLFYQKSGPNGFPWDPREWRAETGIAFPMDLGEVASACERCGYCPSQETIDAGFTLDAARMALRNFLLHGRKLEQEQRCREDEDRRRVEAYKELRKSPGSASAKGMTWQDAQGKLLAICEKGEPYTTIEDLAARIGCGKTTVHKAIAHSVTLKGWQARKPGAPPTPKAQSLNGVVMDNVPSTVGDPADIAAENERLDNAFAHLLDDAKPEERARLNALDTAGQRDLARTVLEQDKERAIEESGPVRTDPNYKKPRRRGNRLLDRKP